MKKEFYNLKYGKCKLLDEKKRLIFSVCRKL